MAIINYPNSSIYTKTPQLPWRIGRYVHRAIPAQVSDTPLKITLEFAERPDKLAFKLYGSPQYYYVFMLRNMNLIRDPVFDMVEGMTIMVPTPTTVRAIFG